jgi:hypothetical protein
MGDGGLSYEPQEGQETDDDFDQEPVDDLPVSKEAVKAVMKLHEAMGHRSRRALVRALVVAGASEESLRAALQLRCWLPWAGAPGTLVADMVPEFVSDEFARWCEFHRCRLHHVPVEAPWQNGVSESMGGKAKVIFGKVCLDNGLAGLTGSALECLRASYCPPRGFATW